MDSRSKPVTGGTPTGGSGPGFRPGAQRRELLSRRELALRRELLLQRVPQPRRALGDLRGPQFDRPRTPPLPLGERPAAGREQREPQRGPAVPRLGGTRPPQGGLRLAALPGQPSP